MGHKAETRTNDRGRGARVGSGPRLALSLTLVALVILVGAALVRAEPGRVSRSLATEEWAGYEAQPLRVNIWHDREDDEVYSRGESIRIHFETNQDAYAVVYRIDAEGRVTILWPRSREDDGFVFGAHTYNLPAPGAARVQAGAADGVEYVEAVVSLYPFDLRAIEADFHHERVDTPFDYYVAGDPFLAMNEVNFAVTGLEDPADYAVTNYTSYYVGREVAHPRYLCGQCHADDPVYEPYRDTCTVEIHYDYGWDTSWYDRYGYYPVYYYPAYYYVDPWTWRPWVNYWYRPWYAWPSSSFYAWNWDYYSWNYSPYWDGDFWVRHKSGDRRYRPVSKDLRYSSLTAESPYRVPSGMVKSKDGRPTAEMREAMSSKKTMPRDGAVKGAVRAPGKTAAYVDRDRTLRTAVPIARPGTSSGKSGLRIPTGDRFQSVRDAKQVRPVPGTGDAKGAGDSKIRPVPGRGGSKSPAAPDRTIRPRPGSGDRGDTRAVKPVQPNKRSSRIWQGGRTTPKRDDAAKRPAPTVKSNKPSTRSTPKTTPRQVKPAAPKKQPAPVRKSSPPPVKKSGDSGKKSGGSKQPVRR